MSGIDPIFVFKQQFGRSDTEEVVNALIHHNPIWQRLKDEAYLRMLIGKIPQQKEFWTAAHICLLAAGIEINQPITDETISQLALKVKSAGSSDFPNPNMADIPMEQVALHAAYILLEGQKPTGWDQLFNQKNLRSITPDMITNGWGSIFSVAYFLAREKEELLCAWSGSASPAAASLLAFVLANNGSMVQVEQKELQDWIGKVVRGNFIRILEETGRYENKDFQQKLANAYLRLHPIKENSQNDLPSNTSADELLGKIALNKDYALVAHHAGDEKQALEHSSNAYVLAENLNQTLGNLKNGFASGFSGISPTADISPASGLTEVPESLLAKTLQAQTVKDSDVETARRIAKGIFLDIKAGRNIRELISSSQIGAVVSPQQLVNLFLDVDLIPEAAEVADKAIEYQPMNAELLKLSAEINHRFGDFQKAFERYDRLEISRDLIREEKTHLADALEQLGNWREALAVWKKVNPVSLEDFQRIAICCYRAGEEQYLNEVVKAAANFYSSDGLFQVLNALFILKAGQAEKAQLLVNKVLESRKRGTYTIQFLIEYFLESGQCTAAREFIDSLSSVEADLPEILVKRCEVLLKSPGAENCALVLKKAGELGPIPNFQTLEALLELCDTGGGFEPIQQLLKANERIWPLSPKLQVFKARSYLNQGNFPAARKILEALVQREKPEGDWLVYYGLSVLEKKMADFPLAETPGNSYNKSNSGNPAAAIFNQDSDNLLLNIIQAECDPSDKLARYQAILAKENAHLNPELWRVYAGMGNLYFQNKQYDLAVVNFREAAKAQPKKKVISLFLVLAFTKMHLYDDALEVFGACVKNNNLEILDVMEVNNSFKGEKQWPQYLEEAAANNPQNIALQYGLVQFYIDQQQTAKALRLIRTVIIRKASQPNDCLMAAQLLIRAGLKEEAGRILEGFLTGNEIIGDNDYLACAFLFIQIGEQSKALNLLNLIERMDYASLILKSHLYQATGFQMEAQAAGRLAIDIYEKNSSDQPHSINRWIEAPLIWTSVTENPLNIYLAAIENRLGGGDLQGAIQDTLQSLAQFPNDFNLRSLALNLAAISGEDDLIETFLNKATDSIPAGCSSDSACIWGEAVLKLGREIQAADLLSQCLELFPSSIRVKALQARILKRNGNYADAQALMGDVLVGLNALPGGEYAWQDAYLLWLAEAALELGSNEAALETCLRVYAKIGLTRPLVLNFLTALSNVTFNNWVNQQLQSTTHLIELSKKVLDFFAEIRLRKEGFGDRQAVIQSLIRDIQIWMGEAAIDYREIAGDVLSSPRAELVASFRLEGGNKAEILLEKYPDDPQMPLIFALLAKDSHPERSLIQLADLMRKSTNQPQHYAALALVKQKLGQMEDAYAAINLALSAWPEEYKWHILAGEISKVAGDVHASLNHFQKAAEISQTGEPQARLGELNLQAGNYLGISYLESQLKGDTQDFDTFIRLGELSIKNNKTQKAVRYLENARKINSKDARPYLMLSAVALKVGNLKKAQENLEVAYLLAPNDAQVIKQKALMLRQSEGTQAALDYLNQADSANQADTVIVIQKAGFITELHGDEQALAYLKSRQNGSTNQAIQLEIARLYLKLGKLTEAENNAELALQANPADPYPLEIMAKSAHQQGDLDKAIDILIKAVQINPFEPVFYIDIAKIYQARRDIRQATDILQSGVRCNPYNFELLNNLGLLYYQQGSYKQAEICLRQASALHPEDDNLKRMLSTLKNANIIQAEASSNSTDLEE